MKKFMFVVLMFFSFNAFAIDVHEFTMREVEVAKSVLKDESKLFWRTTATLFGTTYGGLTAYMAASSTNALIASGVVTGTLPVSVPIATVSGMALGGFFMYGVTTYLVEAHQSGELNRREQKLLDDVRIFKEKSTDAIKKFKGIISDF